ncbi:hypothetical protein EX30DRAFT_375209 [Ascodesmis nigricans]|uniref:Uncharacterized protein n=1 Tax=Ascodesmis nigricans TaxID=341454 RepID=A0A4V3SHM8_9PEZI|nr:hypothetical protein EX30DRAFT_375209 [Ascodesmis nigricans]
MNKPREILDLGWNESSNPHPTSFQERVEERVTENLEEGRPTPLNTVDLTTTVHTQANSKIPKFDPKERVRRLRKRPRPGLPMVEDITITELANLIQRAVETALKETELELATLRKEVAELQKRLSRHDDGLSSRSKNSDTHTQKKNHSPISSPSDHPNKPHMGPKITSCKMKKQIREETNISPRNRTTNAERRIIIERKNEKGPCPAAEQVVAMNAALSKANAPAHIRIQRVEENEKRTVTARTGPKATGLMARNFKKTLWKPARGVDNNVEQMKANETWNKLKHHAVSLNQYYHPDNNAEA